VDLVYYFAMTRDLFESDGQTSSRDALWLAFNGWIAERARSIRAGRRRGALRPGTIEVYQDMWGQFVARCVNHQCTLATIDAVDLVAFLDALGGAREATPRYLKRMLQLIARIDRFQATQEARKANSAIHQVALLARFRFAGRDDDELPTFLTGREARRLVEHVTRRRSSVSVERPLRWQNVRDCTAVALQLGSGITPGEARTLTLEQIHTRGGRAADEPWALSLPASGNFAARQTPLASWAGRQLAYWLELRTAQRIPGDWTFPATRSGKPWSKSSSIRAFQEVLDAAGLDSRGGSYKLRHTFALRQLTRYGEEQVATWLGVQDPAIMERYRRVLFQPVDVV
jgi:integrase